MNREANERKKLLLRIGNRRWTRQLLIVLAFSTFGCARGDWISETMTLVDVTGTWEGSFLYTSTDGSIAGGGDQHPARWVLQQKGGKVTGVVLEGRYEGSIEGLVAGEVFRFSLNRTARVTSNLSYRGEATVTVDEMSGRSDGAGCPCTFVLHRVNTDATRQKQTQ